MIDGVPPELEEALDKFKEDLMAIGVPREAAAALSSEVAIAMFRIREIVSDRMSGEIRALRAALQGVVDSPYDHSNAAWQMARSILSITTEPTDSTKTN